MTMAAEPSDDQTLLNSLIGQVAAGISLAAAFILMERGRPP